MTDIVEEYESIAGNDGSWSTETPVSNHSSINYFTYSVLLRGQWSATLDSSLLVFQVCALLVESILHFLVSSIKFLLGLLQLRLFLLDLLLEDHLHLSLHLGKLSLMQNTFLLDLGRRA